MTPINKTVGNITTPSSTNSSPQVSPVKIKTLNKSDRGPHVGRKKGGKNSMPPLGGGSSRKKEKLYCICQTPYDDNK